MPDSTPKYKGLLLKVQWLHETEGRSREMWDSELLTFHFKQAFRLFDIPFKCL